jgi:hypothetical protein
VIFLADEDATLPLYPGEKNARPASVACNGLAVADLAWPAYGSWWIDARVWCSTAFTKIDVEGYEREVLRDLTRRAGTLSFEVHPETAAVTEDCLQHIEILGYSRFQLSIGESMYVEPQCPNW